MPAESSRSIILVLGMHRAGTSLATALLAAFGVSLSEDLMPPTQFNAMGYFESERIAKIHDRMLAAMGSSWDSSELFKPFPAGWWNSPQIQALKRELVEVVQADLRSVAGMWAFKDPRTARLLPLWKQIIAELGLDARYVLSVRDPREVVKSLQTRDKMDPVLAELLWLEHYAGPIAHLPEGAAAIVTYDGWFTDGLAQAEQLLRALGIEIPAREQLKSVLQPLVASELRHNRSSNEPYSLPYSRELYDALCKRDLQSMATLAQLFEVTRVFAGKVMPIPRLEAGKYLTHAQQTLQHAQRLLAPT